MTRTLFPQFDANDFSSMLWGPYRTFDVDALLPPDVDVETDVPSFATWNDASGEYAEDEVLRLLQETRDCLRDRGFNAFLAINGGIPLDEMDAATQSIRLRAGEQMRTR